MTSDKDFVSLVADGVGKLPKWQRDLGGVGFYSERQGLNMTDKGWGMTDDNRQEVSGKARKEDTTGKELRDKERVFERIVGNWYTANSCVPSFQVAFNLGWGAHAESVKPLLEEKDSEIKRLNEWVEHLLQIKKEIENLRYRIPRERREKDYDG